MWFSLILVTLAAVCNAVMDINQFHWHKSIFMMFHDKGYRGFSRQWWDSVVSWENKYINGDHTRGFIKWRFLGFEFNKPVHITDAFHLFKTIMLTFMIGSVVLYETTFNPLIDFLILGICWVGVFNLFYNKVLKIKKYKGLWDYEV